MMIEQFFKLIEWVQAGHVSAFVTVLVIFTLWEAIEWYLRRRRKTAYRRIRALYGYVGVLTRRIYLIAALVGLIAFSVKFVQERARFGKAEKGILISLPKNLSVYEAGNAAIAETYIEEFGRKLAETVASDGFNTRTPLRLNRIASETGAKALAAATGAKLVIWPREARIVKDTVRIVWACYPSVIASVEMAVLPIPINDEGIQVAIDRDVSRFGQILRFHTSEVS